MSELAPDVIASTEHPLDSTPNSSSETPDNGTPLFDQVDTPADLKKLPREQSEILTKVYLEGKSHQQASDELKLPLGTVKSRVRLALKKLEVLVAR